MSNQTESTSCVTRDTEHTSRDHLRKVLLELLELVEDVITEELLENFVLARDGLDEASSPLYVAVCVIFKHDCILNGVGQV